MGRNQDFCAPWNQTDPAEMRSHFWLGFHGKIGMIHMLLLNKVCGLRCVHGTSNSPIESLILGCIHTHMQPMVLEYLPTFARTKPPFVM